MTETLETITTRRMNRRSFLAKSALTTGAVLGAGPLLQACGGSGSGGSTTLTVMYLNNEFTPAHIQDFEKLHPDIKINFLNFDQIRLNSMMAAGQPPDFVRVVGAPVMPNLIARGLPLDLTPYFNKSTVLKPDNLMPVNNIYRWDGKAQGQGPIYGMAKDWSQDTMMWIDKRVFDQAHIPYPSETEPLTYDELLDLGKRLTVRKNGRIQVYGLDAAWVVSQGHISEMVAQQGGSLFNSDFTKVDFTSPEAIKVLKWYVDWAQAHVGPSPLDPESSWDGPLMADSRVGMGLLGYWFGGQVAASPASLQDHAAFFPAPVMGSKRISACLYGVGAWIPSNSNNKDAAWTLMEYFMGGKPAQERAVSGWGLSPLKSLITKLPQTKPYQQEAYKVQQNEFPYLDILHFSPYVSDDAVIAAISRYIEPVMRGKASLEQGAGQLNDAVNLLLQQGKQQVG